MAEQTSGIETLLDRLRQQLLSQRADVHEQVARIKAAADAYLATVELDLSMALGERLGLEPAREPTAPGALVALRAEVDALSRTGPPASVASPASTTPQEQSPPAPAVEAPRAEDPEPAVATGPGPTVTAAPIPPHRFDAAVDERRVVVSTTTDAALRTLFSEFQETDLDSPSNEVYRAIAEEFACRARDFQDRQTPDASDFVGRIVRKLTALASQRGLRDIFGLKRAHQGDWAARAAHARKERERLLAAPARTVATRVAISESARTAVAEETAADEVEEEQTVDLPRLRALAEKYGIVLMGGIVKNDKLVRLRAQLGKNIEWIPTDASGNKGIIALERRVADGRVGAVVVLEELISHKHYEPIVSAARRSGVHVAYGAKAGKGALAKALGDLEAALATAS